MSTIHTHLRTHIHSYLAKGWERHTGDRPKQGLPGWLKPELPWEFLSDHHFVKNRRESVVWFRPSENVRNISIELRAFSRDRP
jgi:hypothetical protein